MMTTVKEKLPIIIESIENFFKQLPSKMLEIGKNIVQGLANGIFGAKDWLLGKIKEFASGIVDGFKNALQIGSPSKLLADEVGYWTAEGIGVGFIDRLRSVIGNMRNALLEQTGNLSTTVGLTGNLNGIDSKIGNVGGNTSNVVNLTINTQHLDENELDNIFNYMNDRFGLAF